MFIPVPIIIHQESEENNYDPKNDPAMKIRWYDKPGPIKEKEEKKFDWEEMFYWAFGGIVLTGFVMWILFIFDLL